MSLYKRNKLFAAELQHSHCHLKSKLSGTDREKPDEVITTSGDKVPEVKLDRQEKNKISNKDKKKQLFCMTVNQCQSGEKNVCDQVNFSFLSVFTRFIFYVRLQVPARKQQNLIQQDKPAQSYKYHLQAERLCDEVGLRK